MTAAAMDVRERAYDVVIQRALEIGSQALQLAQSLNEDDSTMEVKDEHSPRVVQIQRKLVESVTYVHQLCVLLLHTNARAGILFGAPRDNPNDFSPCTVIIGPRHFCIGPEYRDDSIVDHPKIAELVLSVLGDIHYILADARRLRGGTGARLAPLVATLRAVQGQE